MPIGMAQFDDCVGLLWHMTHLVCGPGLRRLCIISHNAGDRDDVK